MGFGNNVITLAKAHLIAESCAMTYQRPTWPPTEHVPGLKQGYGHYLPWTLGDRLRLTLFSYLYRSQRKLSLPRRPRAVFFRRQDYERTRVLDIGDACRAYLKGLGLDDPASSVVATTDGMWGGYAAIRRARSWIDQLLLSHADTRQRFLSIQDGLGTRLRVGVNIRMGDFLPPQASERDRQGERVVRLPLEWFSRICRQARAITDCEIVLVTDGTPDELKEFLEEFHPVHTIGEPFSALLGLLLLSRCDLVVCSNSTYSRVACFLNEKPYVWFGDTLVRDPPGRYGYLWKDGGTPMPAWAKPSVRPGPPNCGAVQRCFALATDFGTLPEGLRRYLASNGKHPIEAWDDLLYGDPVYLDT